MESIRHKYSDIYQLIKLIEEIEIYYETPILDTEQGNEAIKQLDIINNFIKFIGNKDSHTINYLHYKINIDENFFENELIDEDNSEFKKEIDYTKRYIYDNKRNMLIEYSDSSDDSLEVFEINKCTEEDDYNSVDDINSIDSDKEDCIRENEELNKFFSKSIIELNSRSNIKEFFYKKNDI